MLTKLRIKEIARETGFHACGITLPEVPPQAEETIQKWTENGKHGEMIYLERYSKRRDDFWNRFHDAKSVVVLGVNYYSTEHSSKSTPFVGKIARYAWGKDYHRVISKKIGQLVERFKKESRDSIYFETAVDTKPLLERTLGVRAGLGFMGKQTQLLSLQFGPWLFLSELITNLELEPDEPHQGNCGTCRICIDECPTGAIEETGEIDARKCIAYLTIEHKSEIPAAVRPKIKNWVFGCDECLNVCPYTAKQKPTDWNELTSEQGFGPELDLLKLFETKTNGQYEKIFQGSAISRASRKQLLRNAAVVLGNQGSKSAIRVLEKAQDEVPPMVREHVLWAIQRIENRTLD